MATVRKALVGAVGSGSSWGWSRGTASDAAGRVHVGAFGNAVLGWSEPLSGGGAKEEEGERGEHG